MLKEIKEWIISILVALVVFYIVHTFLFATYAVNGDSMFPTFKDKERVIINKIATKTDSIDRGDIIVFHTDTKNDYIKRFIGKPGDTVEYKNDKLYINGQYIQEDYLKENRKNKTNEKLTDDFTVDMLVNADGNKKIPEGKYLVLGDNREVSLDSRRELGLIDKSDVVGKVSLRIWPFDAFTRYFFEDNFDKVNK
ncbi:signal peptidase I [Macrococcus psychrotolerans]|uniref:Signal peptidase I n=1 Tax=Macrococcus psychrotolerans TaxID=3039389 RepID=A0AAU6RHA4_9STAP